MSELDFFEWMRALYLLIFIVLISPILICIFLVSSLLTLVDDWRHRGKSSDFNGWMV